MVQKACDEELLKLNSPLGKAASYTGHYERSLLFPMPRLRSRVELGISDKLPFIGCDVWNCYELSWLNMKGKPEVAVATFFVPHDSPCIVESKSIKLYLFSFNQTKFSNSDEVKKRIETDLSTAAEANVKVILSQPKDFCGSAIEDFQGDCIDGLDVDIEHYNVNAALLKVEQPNIYAEETLYSHLLRSNCLVTHQPDWGSVSISYKGPKIDRSALLKYIVSFRTHNEFHEPCVERIFVDILRNCRPQELTVHGRYTRRGGLDINPLRTNCRQFKTPEQMRLFRQ